MKITYNYESLDKHGVTEPEANKVYATGHEHMFHTSDATKPYRELFEKEK